MGGPIVDEFVRRHVRIKGSRGTYLATWDGRTTKCRGGTCQASIGFAITPKGGRMPFNTSRPVDIDEIGIEMFEPHFADCIDAQKFKKS
jgi:hypothetical protein